MNYPILPKEHTPIDAHCHFFNKEVLSLHLLIELIMASKRKKEKVEITIASKAQGEVSRALHFLKVGLSPVPVIYKTLEKDESGFAFCPLMFDLDSCVNSLNEYSVASFSDDSWRDEFDAEVQDLIDQTQDIEEKNALEELRVLSEGSTICGRKQSALAIQEEQLTDLGKAFPDKVFPFFVIDPRRYNFSDIEVLKNVCDKFRINGGVFSGIKMYAPCGYSPYDDRLFPLYAYCEEYGIPITAHCSGSGFATFARSIDINGLVYLGGKLELKKGILDFEHYKLRDKQRVEEKAVKLNHPKIWEQVLQKYPLLKLNLAHFGLHDGGEWTREIFALMQKYPNLYTDFSCVSDSSALQGLYHDYYQKASVDVKKRFLYGSDFYLNLLFVDSMQEYLRHFRECFTANEWVAITEENTREFLLPKRKHECNPLSSGFRGHISSIADKIN